MSQDTNQQRTKGERIERLRTRLKAIRAELASNADRQLRDVIAGILDLLGDEL
ncbi:MAG: hypothetical protein AAGL98_00160 [Planctomycetota bacterium]